ncbi:MAG: CvpA family protein [Lentimicrobiaceae bacterium]|jgi:membrane protein required for colicin V production|nr:CvpA family protein [Lentimicrobiaceae bacterium]MDD4599044.1 CvpA family protein [Lentimicrobiaceae bacterium]
MNVFDLFILIVLLIAATAGFVKGFVLSLTALAGWIIGLYISFKFASLIQFWLQSKTGYESSLMYILAFILCFGAVVVVMYLIGKSVQKIIEMAALGLFNRLAGAVFGVLKISLLLSALIYLLATVDPGEHLITPEKKAQSYFYKPVAMLLPAVLPFMQENWKLIFPDSNKNDWENQADTNPGALKLSFWM